jgi:F0F1-type ATP synthase assembly protein I
MKPNLEQLKQKLSALKSRKKSRAPEVYTKISPGAIAIELVSGVIAGLILGLFLGNIFHYKLLWITICLTLGIIAGFRSLWQKSK